MKTLVKYKLKYGDSVITVLQFFCLFYCAIDKKKNRSIECCRTPLFVYEHEAVNEAIQFLVKLVADEKH